MIESVNIEYIEKAKDRVGGYLVHVCRSSQRGRSVNTVWKDLRFIHGRFEKWPGRWGIVHVETFVQNILAAIDQNRELLDGGKRLPFRFHEQGAAPGEYLFRDADTLRSR